MQQKLLPPRLFLIGLALMAGTHLLAEPEPKWGSPAQTAAGIAITIFFLGLTIAGARQFDRQKTNINTFLKPDVLVTTGLFRYTRNPMYLGFAGALAGAAIALNCLTGLIVALVFVAIADRWYIRFEEKVMSQTFGKAYADYCAQTRRWI